MKKINWPWFPFSVILVFILVMILWRIGVLPTPQEMLIFAENLTEKIGLLGLFVAAFIEGLAYVGNQFPGVSIIFIAIVIGSRDLLTIFTIVATVTIAFTLSAIVNY